MPLSKPQDLFSQLSELPTLDKRQWIRSFLDDQKRYRKTQASQAFGGLSPKPDASAMPPLSDTVKTPFERIGFGTPVLKHRSTNVASNHRRRDEPSTTRRSKSTLEAIQPGPETKENQHASKRPPSSMCLTNSTSDTEANAGKKRLRERRQRRRENQAAMKGRRRDTLKSSNEKRQRGKRHKEGDNAGFALMHGFVATNVGGSRLTMKPPLPYLGVFCKGKASAKVGVTKSYSKRRRRTATFSEAVFLDTKRSQHEGKGADLSGASGLSEDPESTCESVSDGRTSKKNSSRHFKHASPLSSHSKKDREKLEITNFRQGEGQTPSDCSRSVVWDIEHPDGVLPSNATSVEGLEDIVLKTQPFLEKLAGPIAPPYPSLTCLASEQIKRADGDDRAQFLGAEVSSVPFSGPASPRANSDIGPDVVSKYFSIDQGEVVTEIISQDPEGVGNANYGWDENLSTSSNMRCDVTPVHCHGLGNTVSCGDHSEHTHSNRTVCHAVISDDTFLDGLVAHDGDMPVLDEAFYGTTTGAAVSYTTAEDDSPSLVSFFGNDFSTGVASGPFAVYLHDPRQGLRHVPENNPRSGAASEDPGYPSPYSASEDVENLFESDPCHSEGFSGSASDEQDKGSIFALEVGFCEGRALLHGYAAHESKAKQFNSISEPPAVVSEAEAYVARHIVNHWYPQRL